MALFKYAVCEVTSFFDPVYDGTLCKVSKVLQVFKSKEEAEEAYEIMSPSNFDDWDTGVRVVAVEELSETFR